MKTVLMLITTVLLAHTAQAAEVSCGKNEKLVLKCRFHQDPDYGTVPRSPVKDYSLCSNAKGKLILKLDTQIHPDITGKRFQLIVDSNDPQYVWGNQKTMKAIQIAYWGESNAPYVDSMRIVAMDLNKTDMEQLLNVADYRCTQ